MFQTCVALTTRICRPCRRTCPPGHRLVVLRHVKHIPHASPPSIPAHVRLRLSQACDGTGMKRFKLQDATALVTSRATLERRNDKRPYTTDRNSTFANFYCVTEVCKGTLKEPPACGVGVCAYRAKLTSVHRKNIQPHWALKASDCLEVRKFACGPPCQLISEQ